MAPGKKSRGSTQASQDFWRAVERGLIDSVDRRIQQEGIDVNVVEHDVLGMQPVVVAAMYGQYNVCEQLIRKHGADVNAAFDLDDIFEADLDRYDRVVDALVEGKKLDGISSDVQETIEQALQELREEEAQKGKEPSEDRQKKPLQIVSLQKAIDSLKRELDRAIAAKDKVERKSASEVESVKAGYEQELQAATDARLRLEQDLFKLQQEGVSDESTRVRMEELQSKKTELEGSVQEMRKELADLRSRLAASEGTATKLQSKYNAVADDSDKYAGLSKVEIEKKRIEDALAEALQHVDNDDDREQLRAAAEEALLALGGSSERKAEKAKKRSEKVDESLTSSSGSDSEDSDEFAEGEGHKVKNFFSMLQTKGVIALEDDEDNDDMWSDSSGEPTNEVQWRRKMRKYRTLLKNSVERIEELESDISHLEEEKDLPQLQAEGGDPSKLDKSGRSRSGTVQKRNEDSADVRRLTKRVELFEKELKKRTKERDSATKKLDELQKRVKQMEHEGGGMEKMLDDLKKRAEVGDSMQKELKEAKSLIKRQEKDLERTQKAYKEEVQLRKKYFNLVEDMKGKIRVYCRVRPMSKTEKERGDVAVNEYPDECTIRVAPKEKEFVFDHVFDSQSKQEDIFEDTRHLIQSAVDGFNVSVFAYGQTGSGKTYTIAGEKNAPGIVPRAMKEIFDLVQQNQGFLKIQVKSYMFELYNDRLYDLYKKRGHGTDDTKYEIKRDMKGMVFITNATIKDVDSLQELVQIYNDGVENRHTRATAMNDKSSRSHLIFAILLESENLQTNTKATGKLSLIDLAGSERQSKTGLTDVAALEEAKSINQSLSALGNVISALSTPPTAGKPVHIPYRDNKLTQLMCDSLGGNAKTLMFVNISPTDYNMQESLISLAYASRVKLITNDASKAIESKEVQKLKSVIKRLKAMHMMHGDSRFSMMEELEAEDLMEIE